MIVFCKDTNYRCSNGELALFLHLKKISCHSNIEICRETVPIVLNITTRVLSPVMSTLNNIGLPYLPLAGNCISCLIDLFLAFQ